MYNLIAKKAYDDGSNYFITMNDDAIITTLKWTSKMIDLIHHNPLLKDFGTTGFVNKVEVINEPFAQFSFVSRIHFEIFEKALYTPVFILNTFFIGNSKLGNR